MKDLWFVLLLLVSFVQARMMEQKEQKGGHYFISDFDYTCLCDVSNANNADTVVGN